MSFRDINEITWKDNIGNDLHIGDIVWTLNGQYTIDKVKALSFRHEIYYEPIVVLESKINKFAVYVLNLTALGVTENDLHKPHGWNKDILGNELKVGDIVLTVPRLEMYVEKGTILKICPSKYKISRPKNRFNKEFHYKENREILSLTALNKEDIELSVKNL